nr:sulfide linked serum amyloid P-component, SL-SAP=pentraxin-like glycoprotein {N-terminal} [Oncorhynchus mykiss=rainbow trout, serum, Peptide Partial, 16 aa] [Oncorhynchus mykiss]
DLQDLSGKVFVIPMTT